MEGLFLLGMIVVALLIPCKYDPAIRLKEWNEEWRKRLDERLR